MPVRKVKGGWKYGTKGKVYKSKAEKTKYSVFVMGKNSLMMIYLIKDYVKKTKTRR